MKVIVITGSIATGKSTVSRYIQDKYIPVIDADYYARVVVEKGKPGLAKLVETFGEAILLEDGTLNRKKLGEIIFNDDESRERVNQILHPLIYEEIQDMLQEYKGDGRSLVFIDIPLYFETKNKYDNDEVWVVYIDSAEQLKRLMKRNNISEDNAQNLINNQISIEEKAKSADIVIDNSKDIAYTFAQVDEALELLNHR